MRILLVNPNTSVATTETMVAMAQRELRGASVHGLTVSRGPAMLIDEESLEAAAIETVRVVATQTASAPVDGVIVGAFGDPGLKELTARLAVPVVGIGSSAMREAVACGRFGIATTTPGLRRSIEGQVHALGLGEWLTGVEITEGDPLALAGDPGRQTAALAEAVTACVAAGAHAVVIGGGPLAESADDLSVLVEVPVINPVRAACRRLRELLTESAA